MEKKQSTKSGKEKNVASSAANVNVNVNSKEKYSLRGRKFEGYVIKKFDKRVVIEFERVNFIKKYERYAKSSTKIHARLPESMKDEIKIGDYIQVMECRPLSKIIHHVVIKKIRDVEENFKFKKSMEEIAK